MKTYLRPGRMADMVWDDGILKVVLHIVGPAGDLTFHECVPCSESEADRVALTADLTLEESDGKYSITRLGRVYRVWVNSTAMRPLFERAIDARRFAGMVREFDTLDEGTERYEELFRQMSTFCELFGL